MSEVARREHILQAAERLLEHYGPQKTTVADVAREAGIGVGTVYLEFPSKEAIIEALSRARHEAVLEAMRSASKRPDATWAERLSGVMDARLEAYLAQASGSAHARDLFHCPNPAVKSASQWFHDEERALVTELLEAGLSAGEFEVADTALTARVILRAYSGFTPPWILCGNSEDTRRLARAMHDVVLHGVVSRR
jgi:AcrR family transcriptional regulator